MAKARKRKSAKAKAKATAKKQTATSKLKRKPAPKAKKKRPLREPVKKAKRAPSKPTKAAGARRGVPIAQKLPEFVREVKRKAPPVRAKPQPKRKRKLSKHPDAVRARRYRAEQKAVNEALAVAKEERLAAQRERARARRRKVVAPLPSEAELAVGWLERIRNDVAEIEACSLEHVGHRPDDPNLWIAVGRFDFVAGVDYLTTGAVLEHLADDIELEAMIHPARLSQVRIVYHDAKARHGENDGTISSIGPWEFILGELIGEILGGGDDDKHALANRYDSSVIRTFYAYFSSEVRAFETAPAFAKTATVKL